MSRIWTDLKEKPNRIKLKSEGPLGSGPKNSITSDVKKIILLLRFLYNTQAENFDV